MKIGDRVHWWRLLGPWRNNDGHRQVKCRCEGCGKVVKFVDVQSLKREMSRSCGCQRQSPLKDLTGQTFGHWTVERLGGYDKYRRAIWLCICGLCGKQYRVAASNLSSGKSSCCKSCAARNLLDPENRAALRAGLEALWSSPDYQDRAVVRRDKEPQRKAVRQAWANPDSDVRLARISLGQRHKGPSWDGLSDEDIRAIRADPRQGNEIALTYNVAESMISTIKHRKAYAHVPGPSSVFTSKAPKVPRKSMAEHLKDAERLVNEHGFIPARQWMVENGYQDLYNKLGGNPAIFGHLPRQMTYGDGDGKVTTVKKARTGRFSDDQIRQIRRDGRPHEVIAAEFGVTRQMIRYIQAKQQYAQVPD